MRKFFTLSVLFLSLLSLKAQLLQGLDAAKVFPNADEVLLDAGGKKARYIHFNSQSNLTIEYINYWAANNLGFKDRSTLVQIGMEKDALGMVHYRYQQYFNGKPVQYSMLIVHTMNGKVISVNGEYYSYLSDNFESNLNETEALQKAITAIGASKYAWQDMLQESIIKSIDNNASATYYPKGILVYVSKNNTMENRDFRLAYKFNIYANKPMSRVNIFVDASNGEILFTENLIHTSNVTGIAHTKYSGTRSIITDSTAPGNYRLRETGRGLGVETYNFKNGSSTAAAVDFLDTNNDWNNVNAAKDEIATDAHWGAEQTYDYYKLVQNRNSIDNAGFKLRSYVHYQTNYNNAFWNGQYMTYGDGDGTTFTPLTALDVCGHEITHGLTSNTANLVYSNESGGLNESFSDVFGTTIEYYARGGAGNWKIGEDLTVGNAGIRNMQNPKLFQDPNTYLKQYWVAAGGADNGGVHTNSGVQNYWYYLMCQGGSGTNDNLKAYNVPGMGMLKAAAITFRSLTVYLTPNSQFADARFFSIVAAKDLYGPCAAEVKTTTNTWSAVGVGADFDSILKAQFYSNDTLICGNSGTAKFVNTSNNAATYFWDFGDGQTSTLLNPSHTYAAQGNYTVKLKVGSCSTPVKYDSVTRVAYIKVSTTNPICLSQKMPTGTATGAVIVACSGKLMDDGGIGNYSAQVNSKRTISPTNAGFIKLKFNSFDFESNYDYLYIYDGPTTASPLIGKYTGSNLPNGGSITTTQGSVTFVESSDQLVEGSGFDLDWQCYMKSPNDIAVLNIFPISTQRQNTPGFSPTSTVAIRFMNMGTVAQSNIPLNYNVNNGTPITGVSTKLLLPNVIDTFYFPTTILNNIGNYTVKAFSTLSTDTMPFNDTVSYSFRIIENDPVILPFSEGFEGMGPDSANKSVFSLKGAGKFDYDNNDLINNYCRYRNTPLNIAPHSGIRLITFDRNPFIADGDTTVSNFLTLTINLSNYLTQNKVYLEFYYKNHGDEKNGNDKVWVRGTMNDPWIRIFTLIPYDTLKSGIFYYITGLRIDSVLKANGQNLSTNTQVKFGQQDNNKASDDANSTAGDGISFDDIRIYNVSTVLNDIAVLNIVPITSARQLTPTYTPSSNVALLIKNVSTNSQTNIPFAYKVNGGAPVTGTYTKVLAAGQVDTFFFTTPITNNIGVFNVQAYNTLTIDSNKTNDTAFTSFKIVENAAIVLPFTEGFEGMVTDSSHKNVFSLNAAGKFDYDNNDSFYLCRYRNFASGVAPHGGIKAITFDRTANATDAFSNFMTLTLNLTNYVLQNKVYLEFYYKSEGDEMEANDKVWVRGNMNNSWIPVYTLIPNDTVKAGIYFYVTGIRIDSILKANGQALSSNTQIRWGQQDNMSAVNELSNDGITFDDIRVYNTSTIGINSNFQKQNDQLFLYPNPAKNEVGVYGISGQVTLTLMDAEGKVILIKTSDTNTTLNTVNLSKGIYLLQVTGEQMNVTRKLVIE